MKRLSAILAIASLPLMAGVPQTEMVRGTVLYSQPWQFFLLKTSNTVLRVATRQGYPELNPGDLVTASGVAARRSGRISIETATYEKTGEAGPVPEPHEIFPDDLGRVSDEGKSSDLFGHLVRIDARVTDVKRLDWGFTDISLDFYESNKPDVLLLDIRMPVVSGLDALEAIRRAHPDAKVAMLTTSELEEDIFRALKFGANGYIPKDSRPSEIAKAVTLAISRGIIES